MTHFDHVEVVMGRAFEDGPGVLKLSPNFFKIYVGKSIDVYNLCFNLIVVFKELVECMQIKFIKII